MLMIASGYEDGNDATALRSRPSRKEIRASRAGIRANWSATHILIRGDSHYCCPEVIDFCRANVDFIFGVAPSLTLRRHVETEASTKARFEAGDKAAKAPRFKEFYDGAASWSRTERIARRGGAGWSRYPLHCHQSAVRVEELKTQIRLHLPSAFPHQAVLRTLLGALPRFVT